MVHIQLNTEVTEARYLADKGWWQVTIGTGESFTCKYFISGMGIIPSRKPSIKGLDSFKGPIFHSSRWPEGLELPAGARRCDRRWCDIGADGYRTRQDGGGRHRFPAHAQLHPPRCSAR
jgi:hypothetical protein